MLPRVGWEVYDLVSDAVAEGSPIRMIYDGKDLEIITASNFHNYLRYVLNIVVHEVAVALGISHSCSGSTTWKRPELGIGLEADDSFYFRLDQIEIDRAAIERRSKDIADYPDPDLAIEVDISPPEVDREDIYKKLKVAEIWYFDGEDVTIEQLGEDGKYAVADQSQFLPIKAVEIRRWLVEEDSTDRIAWTLRLRAWCRRIARTHKPATRRPRRRKAGDK